MSLHEQLAICTMFRQAGIIVQLDISSEEIDALSGADEAALRALGATDDLIAKILGCARAPGQLFVVDFDRETVRVYSEAERRIERRIVRPGPTR